MVLTVNERVKKNYQKCREKILERKRAAYAAKKAKLNAPIIEEEKPLESTTEFVDVMDEPQPPVKIDSLEKVTQLINGLDISDGNKKFRINNLKTIITILKPIDYNNLIRQLVKQPNKVIKLIKNFEYTHGKKYAENTLIALYKAILFYLDKLNINIKSEKKMKYLDQLEINGVTHDKQLELKNNANKLPSFEEYLEKVIKIYGVNSREFLIAKMYQEVKCRDDLQLILVRDPIRLNKEKNYIVVNDFDHAVVIINAYKTIDKYGAYDTALSEELTTLIKSYIMSHQISNGELFFKVKNISMIVSRMNKQLEYLNHGAINLFRKMIASDAQDLPLKEQLKISKQLKHSFKTHNKNYIINENI